MKNRKHALIAGAMCMLPLMAVAQQTEPLTGARRLFDDGKTLFFRHDYAAAQQTLLKYIKLEPQTSFSDEVSYMLACTAYELKAPDCIAQLEQYLVDYPESRYANRVQSLIASAYFFAEKYPEAVASFKGCDIELLDDSERDACALRLATAYLRMDRLKDAALWFNILKEVSRKYYMDAVYNLAYIDYVEKRYDSALAGFEEASASPGFAALSPYYIAEINLVKGNFRKALEVASTYLETYPGQEKAVEMKRIQGEAYFKMKQYAQAANALEAYQREVGAGASREALYDLGMSYYYTHVYSKAAVCLGEAAAGQDALTQNAYLHMGLAYLQLKDRDRARMAFEQASTMDYDREIKEQALYNYALSIHETSYSPFAESVTVFERFLNEYPGSQYTDKVNDYLIEVYMNTRSYQAALNSIAKISHPSDRILEAKQKLLFRMGTQAFAQAAFENAIDYFTRSLELGRYNRQTKADAYYWRGESKYRLEQYQGAASDLRMYLEFATGKTTEEYALALYNLGYTAFKQKQYAGALTWFTRCAESSAPKQKAVIADTYNRMGDCNFYARQFDEARRLYAKAVEADPSFGDYSLFQEAFVLGLQRDYNGKIQALNRMLTTYPSSEYIDDALYEQGRAFVQLEDSKDAIERYSTLLQRYPDSPLARKAASEIGLLYYQNDRYDEAIAAYKKVIISYPGSDEARMAQRDLKSIYVDLNKVDDYMAFASSIPGGANFDVNERDSLTYTAAERVYMKGNLAEAKSSFTRYLQSFPQGAFSVDAHYYLGLIDYNEKNYREAAVHLDKVLAYPDNKYAGEAMAMSADMAYTDKDYAKALNIYRQMADKATAQDARIEALTGALRCAWMLNEPEEVVGLASSVLAQNKLNPELETEARYYRAKALLKDGKGTEAVKDLEVLAKDTRNVYGAEAKYLLAQYYFDEGNTAEAEKEILDYIDVSTPYAYWLARSFVLLSDVYMKLGRNLDAKQYLLSLKQNYQADDDIAEMIETRLSKLNK